MRSAIFAVVLLASIACSGTTGEPGKAIDAITFVEARGSFLACTEKAGLDQEALFYLVPPQLAPADTDEEKLADVRACMQSSRLDDHFTDTGELISDQSITDEVNRVFGAVFDCMAAKGWSEFDERQYGPDGILRPVYGPTLNPDQVGSFSSDQTACQNSAG